jgi:hypothetical protein
VTIVSILERVYGSRAGFEIIRKNSIFDLSGAFVEYLHGGLRCVVEKDQVGGIYSVTIARREPAEGDLKYLYEDITTVAQGRLPKRVGNSLSEIASTLLEHSSVLEEIVCDRGYRSALQRAQSNRFSKALSD